jgi:hypothetical protein
MRAISTIKFSTLIKIIEKGNFQSKHGVNHEDKIELEELSWIAAKCHAALDVLTDCHVTRYGAS